MSALVRILGDLMHDAQLRQGFNLDPEGVMGRYGLSHAQRSVLMSMNPGTIAAAVQAEITGFPFPDEFPVDGENCLPEANAVVPIYPAPRPGVFRLRPRKIAVADIQNGLFELLVYGQSFSRDASLVVTHGSAQMNITGEHVFGTFRCSRLRAVVAAQQPGAYRVQLKNCPGSANEELFPAPYDLQIV